MIATEKQSAVRWLRSLQDHVIRHPQMYTEPDHGLGTSLAIATYILMGAHATVLNEQTHGIALLQLVNRLLEEI